MFNPFTLPRLPWAVAFSSLHVKEIHIFAETPGTHGSTPCYSMENGSTIRPATSAIRRGSALKTCCGVPAAAQTSPKSRSLGSKNPRGGVRWPSGETPPMANPVTARMKAASACPSGSPASASARAMSTRRPPAVTKSHKPPEAAPRNRIDLAIWSISHPTALAASSAVRLGASVARIVSASPAACIAWRTRVRLLLMRLVPCLPLPFRVSPLIAFAAPANKPRTAATGRLTPCGGFAKVRP